MSVCVCECVCVYLGVTILIVGLLSSSRQLVSLTQAFMELSDSMSTRVEMVPKVNSASFSCSCLESST